MSEHPPRETETIRCPHCGSECRAAALACPSCGQLLRDVQGDALETLQIPRELLGSAIDDPGFPQGTSRFTPGSVLYVSIERVNSPIARYVRDDQPIVIGREDTSTLDRWDINLSPYKGRELGVSRRHAQITLEDGTLYIEDLESSNGTVLNGEVLKPGDRHKLRDGDELMVGRMMVWVNF